jgi:hypothetical protein
MPTSPTARSARCTPAITSWLVATAWAGSPALERVFKVALTMNLSMLELQGLLARQRNGPTPSSAPT